MAPSGSLKSTRDKAFNNRHKHKWIFAEIRRWTNRPSEGLAVWVCECGAFKEVAIFNE